MAQRRDDVEHGWKVAAAEKRRGQNRFEALAEDGGDDDGGEEPGEINAVTAKDEDEITVDSGAARNVWPKQRKEGGKVTPADKGAKLVAANGTDIPISGEKVVKFVNDGRHCAMKFLVTTVKKPLAAVSSIVDEGNVVVFGPGKDGSFIQNVATGERIMMRRKKGTFVINADFGAAAAAKQVQKKVAFGSEDDGGRRPMEIGAIQGNAENDAAVFRRRA